MNLLEVILWKQLKFTSQKNVEVVKGTYCPQFPIHLTTPLEISSSVDPLYYHTHIAVKYTFLLNSILCWEQASHMLEGTLMQI